MSSRLRIAVLGYVVRGPIGGLAWHHVQYLLGLRALGHDAWFLEESEDYPACYNPDTHEVGIDPSYGLAFASKVFTRLGLGDRWTYHDAHTATWHGARHIREACASADILLNLSGVNPIGPLLEGVPARVYVDTDPAFTQVRNLTLPAARARSEQHTHFFTYGERFGQPDCGIPADGFAWQPTRQPVVLDAWPETPAPVSGACTTVMQWDSYRPVEYGGRLYGMKSASFEAYRDLPTLSPLRLELALGSATAPREELAAIGWSIRDPLAVAADPWIYQEYIAGSRAEFSVAKQGYVDSRSGWFSERSAAYLASGRPVITQDTGFSDWLSVDAGVLPFSSALEAVAALNELDGNYARHAAAARACAAEYFDASRVLDRLLTQVA